jgi:hypothetical protein
MGGMVSAQWNDPVIDRVPHHGADDAHRPRRVAELDLTQLDAIDTRHDETVS